MTDESYQRLREFVSTKVFKPLAAWQAWNTKWEALLREVGTTDEGFLDAMKARNEVIVSAVLEPNWSITLGEDRQPRAHNMDKGRHPDAILIVQAKSEEEAVHNAKLFTDKLLWDQARPAKPRKKSAPKRRGKKA